MSPCSCGTATPADYTADYTANPPGQRVLHRRVATQAASLARMREVLGAPGSFLAMRSLARHGTDDPAIALLDAWAVVADVVAFYNERIATEGFLRTATERLSVRELARSLGYELRPGVTAQVELAFRAEAAEGSPEVVTVPKGTPVQTVPGPVELPQTFETSAELEARGAWNSIPAVAATEQPFGWQVDQMWLPASAPAVRVNDHVLIVGSERAGVTPTASHGDNHEKWDFRRVTAVEPGAPHAPGWTRLSLNRPLGFRRTRELVAKDGITVHLFTERANLFGWNAPDPDLMTSPEATTRRAAVAAAVTRTTSAPAPNWPGYPIVEGSREVELDGDHKSVVPRSWLVLEQPGRTEVFQVTKVEPDGATKFGLSGRLTRVTVDISEHLADFRRNTALVHSATVPLPAGEMPLRTAIGKGSELVVAATEPPLPANRPILVSGQDYDTGAPVTDATRALTCTPSPDGRSMTLVVEPPLAHAYHPDTVTVSANVVTATHGETVEQVLGSGDGRTGFPQFELRRAPLTYVRATTPDGSGPELSVRVDGVEWQPVPDLGSAGPNSRVYAVRQAEDGETAVVFGDGQHGARLPTGAENVQATYRAGIGAAGAADPGQVRLLVRRPLGIRDVVNPAAASDWAPEEQLEDARTNAPLRVRTLDRAVSVADYEDFARGYAGVGNARADLVWDGRREVVAVSLLGVEATRPSNDLVDDLRTTLDSARDPGPAMHLTVGEVLWFGVRVEIAHDPSYEKNVVRDAVRVALQTALAPQVATFAQPVAAAAVLVLGKQVPGVLACTMPRLFALPDPPGPDPALPPVLPPDPATGGVRTDLLVALPGRWGPAAADPAGSQQILPAQLLGLAPGGVEVGVMSS